MNRPPWRTLLAGFGQIAAGYATDPVMARHYRYASHAQVLSEHTAFMWDSVIDPDERAREHARVAWNITHSVASVIDMPERETIEVLVLANPPAGRMELLQALPGLKAVLVEKPLGPERASARQLLDYCEDRGLPLQVNLLRRADTSHRQLAEYGLRSAVGRVQGGLCLYGNGLYNNGSHMVDLLRMLLGEIRTVQALESVSPFAEGPLANDFNVPFTVTTENDATVFFQPLRFDSYRENGLDLWGDDGRLSLMQEGLLQLSYPRMDNRALSGSWEVASDQVEAKTTSLGEAFYQMYENLAAVMMGEESLVSPGASAMRTEEVLQAVRQSADQGGRMVVLF